MCAPFVLHPFVHYLYVFGRTDRYLKIGETKDYDERFKTTTDASFIVYVFELKSDPSNTAEHKAKTIEKEIEKRYGHLRPLIAVSYTHLTLPTKA